jgi:glycosyltransferase involved in cell wall biosynthesis
MLLSVVIPCYNEQDTLARCVDHVLRIADADVQLQIVIVDDCSKDRSHAVALELARRHPCITVVKHERNRGKGAAVRTGFANATGDVVAIQDADLEYDPQDLKRMLEPISDGRADVVLGSRFLSSTTRRVLYFWHSVANRVLTLLSNMFTDLNLTDMECCYKVFTRDVAKKIVIHEDRFGVEPELVAQVAQMRLRVYEMGISYSGRTYEEGKKIGLKDAFRALYCIIRYNGGHAPVFLQFLVYSVIGGTAAVVNLIAFLLLLDVAGLTASALTAFFVAAGVNYALCVWLLFERRVQWSASTETLLYLLLICAVAAFDLELTRGLIYAGVAPGAAKATAALLGLLLNFLGRRFIVFPQRRAGSWKRAVKSGSAQPIDEAADPGTHVVVGSEPPQPPSNPRRVA